jgi:hypothetical protein
LCSGDEQVTLADVGSREFLMHVACRGFVGEPVALSCLNACHASFKGRKQNDVVQGRNASGRGEGGKEPRSDDAVKHRGIPTGDVATCRGRCGLGDYLVLLVCLREPGWDGTADEEAEEGVALDEHASLEPLNECLCNRGFSGAGWASHDDKEGHAGILAHAAQ